MKDIVERYEAFKAEAKRTFIDYYERVLREAGEAADRKQYEIDKHGYGGKTDADVVGFDAFIPSSTTWPAIGCIVEDVKYGREGTIVRNKGGRLPWVVLRSDGTETGYASHEIRHVSLRVDITEEERTP